MIFCKTCSCQKREENALIVESIIEIYASMRIPEMYIQLKHQQLIRKFIGVHPETRREKNDKHLNKPPLFRTSFYRKENLFQGTQKEKP